MGRVLLVKLGAIGDVLMLLPAAAALHQKGYEVHWLCGERVAPMLRLYPWIRLVVTEERTFLKGGASARAQALLRLWPQLMRTRYDLIATLYYNPRYRLLTLPVRAGRRLWLREGDRARMLLPGRHHSDEYARLLLALPDDVRPEPLAPVPPDTMPASPLEPGSRPRVVIVPGGARNLLRDDALRRWPIESYAAVARSLAGECDVVVVGGADDTWVLPAFGGIPVQECVGRYSLVETLGLLASSAVVVTHDTGPLHLAGLTDAGIVSIFGPTDPHARLPQRPGAIAIWGGEGFACRACYDGRDYANCQRNECVRQVTPERVVERVRFLLQERRLGRWWPARVESATGTPEREHRQASKKRGAVSSPTLFLDRDGVINEEIGYLIRTEDVRFVPGVESLCRCAQELGYRIVVVTNQSGIARGLYTEAEFHGLMDWMKEQLRRQGVVLDGVYFCPFHPEHGIDAYRREHTDRKPNPGMLLRAAKELDLDLSRSVMVGDRCSDVLAANAAGLRQAFLLQGTEGDACAGVSASVRSLHEVEAWLRTEGPV